MRILLIEDEPKTVQSLKQGFEENQMEVDFAYDGYTGKLLAERNTYDIIISDIIIPHTNGIELCRQFRRKGLITPIIMLSALDTLEDKIIGLEAGADDYVVKPFELHPLNRGILLQVARIIDLQGF